MKYKIQFKSGWQCGVWDDLLDDDYYEGQQPEPVVGTHVTMTEYDSIEDANAQIELEKEDYRDAYDHHTEEKIEEMMPDYQVVPSHLNSETELRDMEERQKLDEGSSDFRRMHPEL